MKIQLSLELLIYLALAGLSFVFALSVADKVIQAYNIQDLFHFDCLSTLKNISKACS